MNNNKHFNNSLTYFRGSMQL